MSRMCVFFCSASGCVHGGSGRRHGRRSAGFPFLPTAEKKEDGGEGEGSAVREEVAGFSWAAGGAPDTARRAVLFRPLDPTSG